MKFIKSNLDGIFENEMQFRSFLCLPVERGSPTGYQMKLSTSHHIFPHFLLGLLVSFFEASAKQSCISELNSRPNATCWLCSRWLNKTEIFLDYTFRVNSPFLHMDVNFFFFLLPKDDLKAWDLALDLGIYLIPFMSTLISLQFTFGFFQLK